MNWTTLMAKFPNSRVLVVGDICLDRWCRYDPAQSDVSRETGIPRLGIITTQVTPGAGGTVANNLKSLGAGKVSVLGAIGQDGFGFELERALAERQIDYGLLVATEEIQTFTYSKIINARTGIEDKPRFDFINHRPLPGEVEDQLIANFHAAYRNFDVVIVADQAETSAGGVITPALREVIVDVAERNPSKIVIADSRARIHEFRHVIAKPNEEEAEAASKELFGDIDYAKLRRAIGPRPLIVTRGAEGALLIEEQGVKAVEGARIEAPVDICGAGDSFTAGLALALHAGAGYEAATRFGSLVASVTIMKSGTGTASPHEVLGRADTMAATN